MNTVTTEKVSPYKTLAEFRIAQPDAYEYAFKSNLLEKFCKKFGWETPYFKKVRNKNENHWRTYFHLQGQTPQQIEKSIKRLIKFAKENPNYLTQTVNNNSK